jgi:leucyl-tRNA synthetase
MGHVRNYTFGDLLTRYRTMRGDAVLSPMGFDSFGLPAENAAIKTGRHPRGFTDERIEELRSSITRIGGVYDWRREVKSHDPEYIRWSQWIFLRFLEAGLAYRKAAPVNWDPIDQTAPPSAPAPLSRSATWSSGTSGSPTTPSSCSTTWRRSTGPTG